MITLVRVVAAYWVTAWLIVQVVDTIFPAFGFGDAAVGITAVVLDIGLIPTLIPAWRLNGARSLMEPFGIGLKV